MANLEKIKKEDLEALTKESLVDKFLRLQDLFFELKDVIEPILAR